MKTPNNVSSLLSLITKVPIFIEISVSLSPNTRFKLSDVLVNEDKEKFVMYNE